MATIRSSAWERDEDVVCLGEGCGERLLDEDVEAG